MRKLAGLRVTTGFSQKEVAAMIGVSQATMSLWECKNIQPRLNKIPLLANIYGVTEQEIIEACMSKPNSHTPSITEMEVVENV